MDFSGLLKGAMKQWMVIGNRFLENGTLQPDMDTMEFFHRGGKTAVPGHPEMEVTQEVALEYVYGAVGVRPCSRTRANYLTCACKSCMQSYAVNKWKTKKDF